MNSFVDTRKISSYSLALSEKLINELFSTTSAISGAEIKQLTPITQINLFIFKNLFEKWQEETSRLKSPYFNYDNEEVRNALQSFLNTLSNHILISKEFFRPLLTKAIEDTLYLSMAPKEYFNREVSFRKDLFFAHFDKNKKFIRVNTPYYDAIDSYIKSTPGLSWQGLSDYVQTLDLIPEQTDILPSLNELLKIELDDILLQPRIEVENTPTEIKAIQEEQKRSPSLNNTSPTEQRQDNRVSDERITPPFPSSLNDRFCKEELTLNDHLKTSDNTAYTPLVKIDDLRTAIGLGEKFVYIKELFQDDVAAYAIALAEIEKAGTLEKAMEFLRNECWSKYNWNISNIHLQEFISLIERRFGSFNHQRNNAEL